MSMKDKYPNQLYYMLLITAEEILGKNGLNSVLNYAGLQKFIGDYPPSDMEEIHPSFTSQVSVTRREAAALRNMRVIE